MLESKAKIASAEYALKYIRDDMIVGLGSGSSVSWFIRKLGDRIREEGLKITAVASSVNSENLARSNHIPVVDPSAVEYMDIYIDGANEVDKSGNLIKGGGGSLLREKILAFNSRDFHVIVDTSKLVDTLGKFPLPLEAVPFGVNLAMKNLAALGCTPVVRMKDGKAFVTDNGNLIVDCQFISIVNPVVLDGEIKKIPGVVETGLFEGVRVRSVIVGLEDGGVREIVYQ